MKGKTFMLARTVIVSVAVAAVVALGVAARASASARATHGAAVTKTIIKVETHGAIFKMSAKTAPRGVVIFKVKNTNIYHHDFSIKGRTTPILAPGQSATLRVDFLRPGRYPYRCTLPHHAGWGQKGVFTIT